MHRITKLILVGLVSLGVCAATFEDGQQAREQPHAHVEKPNVEKVVRAPQIADTGVRPITLNLADQMPPWADDAQVQTA